MSQLRKAFEDYVAAYAALKRLISRKVATNDNWRAAVYRVLRGSELEEDEEEALADPDLCNAARECSRADDALHMAMYLINRSVLNDA